MSELRDVGEVFPLRDFLREEMEARDWGADELALRMGPRKDFGINRLTVDFILFVEPMKGALLGPEASKCLAGAFGTSDDFWMNLDKAWQPEEYVRYEARRQAEPAPSTTEGEDV